ncbi:MAG: hypothetical protein CSA35_00720, partial [Dethiosulfovibrio peptidovorans]
MTKLRLRGKMLALLLGALVIIQGSIVAYTALTVRTNAIDQATKLVLASSREEAEVLSKTMTRIVVTAQNVAAALEKCNRTAPEARKDVLNMVREALVQTPGTLAIWFVFEPNAFDGKDAEFAGLDGFQETGRFEGNFIRNGDSILRTYDNTEEAINDGDWYTGTFSTGRPHLAEPYAYSYIDGGEEYFMTSVSIPIKRSGETIGVVGMDIDLEMFAKEVAGISVTEHDYSCLFSNEGCLLAHPNEAFIGKSLKEIGGGKIKNLDKVLNLIAEGGKAIHVEYSLELEEDALKAQIPVSLGTGLAPWGLAVVVPLSDVTAAPNRLIRNLILTSLLGLVLLGLVI